MPDSRDPDLTARADAIAWTQQERLSFCDHVERWEHGMVMRASRFPAYFRVNVVRVQDDPHLSVPELVAFADRALAGLEQRCIAFDDPSVAEPLRAEFHALGFRSIKLTLMRFEGQAPPEPEIPIREVEYDAVRELRRSWNQEDLFRGGDDSEFEDQAREVRLALGMRVLAVFEGAEPIAFATLDLGDDEIEIGGLYVLPEHRGFGRGTALTKAAITAAGGVKNLWICADDEDRPKDLYARLGFRPVLTWTNFLRLTP